MSNPQLLTFINQYIDQHQPQFSALSDSIWDHPETRFTETYSANLLADALEQEGFRLERGVGGIETAFIASYGSGQPVIALLGEYDALAGLSQQAGCATPQPLVENGNGHGCGHNLLGTAALAGAFAVKAWMQQQRLTGTVRFYGCPGEEGGSGKTFMVREGLFDDVDAALTWHPEGFSGMFNTSTLANIQAAFQFKGIAAHAANSPHLGRSALDAVTLMNTGANFLREHIVQEARLHYAVTNTGGSSPQCGASRCRGAVPDPRATARSGAGYLPTGDQHRQRRSADDRYPDDGAFRQGLLQLRAKPAAWSR
ncbi:Aminobenzoyl-glutamate utilization protein B [Serratia quinivorans]|uniref:Aminobenzoyl-glutamate utilization protein B n=1 Tax=Serratia quinivorans TaxID=137545 RepID=A0A379ZW15_9GAMM|nr:Aminobenzoyl-glutamate utilization protein B [Serratia quinivorans]